MQMAGQVGCNFAAPPPGLVSIGRAQKAYPSVNMATDSRETYLLWAIRRCIWPSGTRRRGSLPGYSAS